MFVRLLIRWVMLAAVLALVAWVVPDVEVSGGLTGVLVAAAVFAAVNTILGPVLRLLSLPITMVTFGLFALVVNGALLALSAGLSDHLDVGGPLSTILAALLMTILTTIVHLVTGAFHRR